MIPGICQFCGDKSEDDGGTIDGNRVGWLNSRRDCCNRSECTRARNKKIKDEREAIAKLRRSRRPEAIEKRRKEQRREQRRRERERRKARKAKP
ncbi:MAG TPA: hypothetical protein VKB47_08610 [Terracidiphilus sp.]|nr:hypothetical protein [Terracidiphilus sp.]